MPDGRLLLALRHLPAERYEGQLHAIQKAARKNLDGLVLPAVQVPASPAHPTHRAKHFSRSQREHIHLQHSHTGLGKVRIAEDLDTINNVEDQM